MAGCRGRRSRTRRGGEHRPCRALAARPGLSRRAQDRGGRRQLDRRHPRGGRAGSRQHREAARDRGRSAARGLDREALGRAARREAGSRTLARDHLPPADGRRHRASFRQLASSGRQRRNRTTRPRLVDGALAVPILLGAAAGPRVRLLLSEALPVSSRQRFGASRGGCGSWMHAGPHRDVGGGGRNCRDSRSTVAPLPLGSRAAARSGSAWPRRREACDPIRDCETSGRWSRELPTLSSDTHRCNWR